MALRVEVKAVDGVPALFIDGQADTGLMLFFGRVREAAEAGDIRNFHDAGIDGYSGGFGLWQWVQPDGTFDFTGVRQLFDAAIAANPSIRILPRVGLGLARPGHPWHEQYRDEMQLNIHPVTGEKQLANWFSFSSRVWRELVTPALDRFVRLCEEHYGDHIIGYHLGSGAFGEWSYSWDPALSDYSAPQVRAFRDWLRTQYRDDSALRAAWANADVALDTAEIPRDRLRTADGSILFDPARDRANIDYLTFHSQAVADAILHFCSATKGTLRDLGRHKLCGVFYNYHLKNMNRETNYLNAGHFAADRLLASPDVDFLCAPYVYTGREPGGMYASQHIAGSTRLHNKFFWCEDDTFTFTARPEHQRWPCPDLATTIGVYRRNLMGYLGDGGSAWWMDCGANSPTPNPHHPAGWYRDADLLQNFAAMQRLAAERLAQPRDVTSQVAVFLSDASAACLRHDKSLIDPLIFRQTVELGALGAPFDTYRVEDLPRLLAQPAFARYRLLIFLAPLRITAEQRAAIEQARTSGRTFLWIYAAGIVTDNCLSTDAMHALTGLRVGLRFKSEELLANTHLTGTRILYGTERAFHPVPYGDDPHAQTLARYLNTADPAMLSRDFGTWRSIWSGAPALPAAILRHLARDAGVHLYVDTGDQIIAERGYLTLHASSDGARTIYLPAPATLRDAFTKQTVCIDATRFDLTTHRGHTHIWTIDD